MVTPDLSVVLPAFNSASYIADSTRRLIAWYEQVGLSGEVVIVDDGSTDGTSEAVPQSTAVRVLRLSRNRGKGAAVKAGMLEAEGRVRVYTDAELPYGTDPILKTVRYILEKGYHAVLGDRTLPGSSYLHEGPLRQCVSAVGGLMLRMLITGGIYDTQCGFKGFRADVAEGLFPLVRVNRFAIDAEVIYLLLKYRLEIKRIPVQLCSQVPSTVRVLRDSTRAFIDVVRIPWHWHRGLYHSERLRAVLLQDLAREDPE